MYGLKYHAPHLSLSFEYFVVEKEKKFTFGSSPLFVSDSKYFTASPIDAQLPQ